MTSTDEKLTLVQRPVVSTGAYDTALRAAEEGLAATQAALTDLRAKRDQINDLVRELVAEEELLNRMVRVARKKVE